jgi:glycosyltransferase involved in cell wall biosynthesis
MPRPRRFFVVTPVLNGAQYLEATLASIDAQSYEEWTHYVADGGSTDGTADIIQRSLQSQPRRRLLPGPDLGLYDGVLKGFSRAHDDGCGPNDICLWLNADDLLAPWAFATMLKAFDDLEADWVTAFPGSWDTEGRLLHLQPIAWHPRLFIRLGLFNGRCLGWIQQESTFFTRRLLDLVPPDRLEAIRSMRVAGDFFLWREFARLRPLQTIPTLIGGFRCHGANASIVGMDFYYRELRQTGAFLPPALIGRVLHEVYWLTAVILCAWRARRFGSRLDRERNADATRRAAETSRDLTK